MQIQIGMVAEAAAAKPVTRTVRTGSVLDLKNRVMRIKADLKDIEKDLAVAKQLAGIKSDIEKIRARIEKAKTAKRTSVDVATLEKERDRLKARYDKTKDKLVDLSNVNAERVQGKRDKLATKLVAAETALKKKQDEEAKAKIAQTNKSVELKDKLKQVTKQKPATRGVTDAATQKKVDALRAKRDAEIKALQDDYKEQILKLLNGRSEIRKEGVRPLSSTNRPTKLIKRK